MSGRRPHHPVRPDDPDRRSGGRDRVRSFYERLLGLYPLDFRHRYTADLLQAFDDPRGEARFRGTRGGVRLVLVSPA